MLEESWAPNLERIVAQIRAAVGGEAAVLFLVEIVVDLSPELRDPDAHSIRRPQVPQVSSPASRYRRRPHAPR